MPARGMHHVALPTSEIARAVKTFEALHAPLLAMPGNSHDNLAARLGLDDMALSALQRHGLLHDRDDAGEFRHLYADSFQDHFFFEVVERRDRHSEFSASNALVRAATQARQQPIAIDLL